MKQRHVVGTLKKLLTVAACAFFAHLGLAATDYYVGKTGQDAEGYGTSADTPYLTIGYALGKAKTSGDRVFVAEGDYQERNLKVAAGVGLIATGSRDGTTIDANGSDSDLARCLTLAASSYVKGFTIKNGWRSNTVDSGDDNGGGVSATASSAVIDCAIRHCRGYRGGGGNNGIWIRCYFANDNKAGFPNAGGVYGPKFVANCVFDGSGCIGNAGNEYVVNCTFSNKAIGLGTNSAHGNDPLVCNSLYGYGSVQTAIKVYTCVLPAMAYSSGSIGDKDDYSVFYPTVTASSPTVACGADFVPAATATNLLSYANQTLYKDNFPEAWKEIGEWEKDYYGNYRFGSDGKMDIGACQYDYWSHDGKLGYDYVKEASETPGKVKFTFTRNAKSVKPLKTLSFGGESVDFTAQPEGYAFVVEVEGEVTDDFPGPCVSFCNVSTWYVDATKGNDDNAGYDASIPLKTIAKAKAKATSGQIIYLAESDDTYDAGNTLPNGVGLVASGRRDKTVIDGGGTKTGLTLGGNSAYVKGVRFNNCGARGVEAGNYRGAIVGCSFYSCYSSYRGGAGQGGVWIGCYFDSSNSDVNGQANSRSLWAPYAVINCVFNGEGTWGGGYYLVLNCSYVNGARLCNNTPGAVAYNTYVNYTMNACTFTNCVSVSGLDSHVKCDKDTVLSAPAASVALNADYSPTADAYNLIGKGKKTYYDEMFPAAWAQFKDVDYNGQARYTSDGGMERGACQYDYWSTDGKLGFDYTKEAAGEGQVKFTFTRNDKSAKPLVTLSFGGETVNYDEEKAGYAFSVTVAGSLADAFPAPALTYAATMPDWYVDAVNGDDSKTGYRPEFACKTLAAVMANVTSHAAAPCVVHAAAGVYDKGEMPGSVSGPGVSTNRVVVPANVGLVAEEGRDKTFIVGSFGAETICDDAAVRCVRLAGAGAYVKDFTITGGGAAYKDGGQYNSNGGGVCGVKDSAAIGCVVTNCIASRGGLVSAGYYIGCYFKDGYSFDSKTKPTELVSDPSTYAKYKNNTMALAYDNQGLINSYFDEMDVCFDGMVLNCYQAGEWKAIKRRGDKINSLKVYNSVVSYPWQGSFYNCISRTAYNGGDNVYTNGACKANVPASKLQLDADKRPKGKRSVLIDAGDTSFYDTLFPAAWAQYKDYDYAGGARIKDAIDVGCGEHQKLSRGLIVIVY